MIKDLIKKLISKKEGSDKVLSKKFKAIPFKKEYFSIITSSKARNVYSIDGGNSIIIDGGSWVISKIKIGVVEYNETRKIGQNVEIYYAFIVNKKNYEITITNERMEELKFDFEDYNHLEIDEVPNKIMKLLEWESCKDLCKKEGLFILMDSPLEGEGEIEEGVINQVKESNNTIVGFCKTSRMRTINGRSLLGVIHGMSTPKTSWFYYPLYEDEKRVNTFIVKLNENSKFCHKVQLFSKEKPSLVLPVLKYFAGDSETRGYPYPLMKADKVARVTHFEKQGEKNKMERELKNTELINDVHSQDFHTELDKRMYRE